MWGGVGPISTFLEVSQKMCLTFFRVIEDSSRKGEGRHTRSHANPGEGAGHEKRREAKRVRAGPAHTKREEWWFCPAHKQTSPTGGQGRASLRRGGLGQPTSYPPFFLGWPL